jgi:hypothetical protein
MTPLASTEALRREALCQQAEALIAGGVSQNEAARQLLTPAATLHRYLKAWRAGGFEGIVPRQTNSGATSLRERFVVALGEEAVVECEKKVAGLALDLSPAIASGSRRLSDGLAWRHFARSPECPAPIREYFAQARRSKHTIAPSLRQSTRPGAMLDALHHGRCAYGLAGPYQPRTLDILPGDIFSSDDTTPIWAWWVPWPKSDAYPHGVKLLQGQFLPVIDVASQHILTYALIAREKSSYRAADIWRLMGRVHSLVGLPRLGWQKERGSWEATLIDGATIEPEDGEPGHTRRVGGLRMLPANLTRFHHERLGPEKAAAFRTLRTWTSYLPKSKSVEGIFHRLQKFEGTIYGALGRSQQRRPFEKAKKQYDACRAGAADPRLHFLSGTELMHKLNAAIAAHEAECLEGEVFRGVPPETWEAGLREHGELLPAPPEGAWLMCSDWALVTIRQGMARVRRTDEATGVPVSYHYAHPDFMGSLDGRAALVYFNRDAFEQPAHILLPSASGNHTYIGQAEHIERRGMFLDGDITGFELRTRQSGIVTTLYSDLAAHLPSRRVPAEIIDRRVAAVMAVETRHPGGDFLSSESRPPGDSGDQDGGGRGAQRDPATGVVSRMNHPRRPVSAAFDEAAELARIAQLEAAEPVF